MTPNPTPDCHVCPTPLTGSALDEFCRQCETLVFMDGLSSRAQRRARDKLPQRRAQALATLQAQAQAGGFAPATLLQIQRLHRLWLELGQFEQASAVISRWGEAVVQAIANEPAGPHTQTQAQTHKTHAQTHARIELLLADSTSRCHFDRAGGLDKLHNAAALIRGLPIAADVITAMMTPGPPPHYPAEEYWDELQQIAEHCYHDWQLTQQALDWHHAQEEAAILASPHGRGYDPAWMRATCCLEKARVAHRRVIGHLTGELTGEGADHGSAVPDTASTTTPAPPLTAPDIAALKHSIQTHVHAAIAHKAQVRFEWDTAPWLWSSLADELLHRKLMPFAVPAFIQAETDWYTRTEPQAQAQLAAFLPDPAQRHTLRQSVRTYRVVEQEQLRFKAYEQIEEIDEAAMSYTAQYRHARRGHYNTHTAFEPEDETGGILLHYLAHHKRYQDAATLALQIVLEVRQGNAIHQACKMARHCLKHRPPTWQHSAFIQLACCLIMLHASRHPGVQHLIKQAGSPLPEQDADYWLAAARAIAPDDPLIDLVQGQHLADQQHWHAALPLLERAATACPQWLDRSLLRHLWACRAAVLGAEPALARPWPLAASACCNYVVGLAMQNPAPSRPEHGPKRRGPGDFLPPPEYSRQLVPHYLQAALAGFDRFWHTWGKSGSPTPALHFADCVSLNNYSDLCLQLAAIYTRQQRHEQAQALHRQGIAVMTFPFYEHAQGLHACALALGETAHAAQIQKAIDTMD